MTKRTLPSLVISAKNQQATLSIWQAGKSRQLVLDSPDWFAWLAEAQSFRLIYRDVVGQETSLTIRPEKRGQRTYWQAWKTIKGQTRKKYLAPTAKLTQAKLDEVARWFAALIETEHNRDDSLILYALVTDLAWLLERFVEHHPHSPLVGRAQAELKRVRHIVGN